MIRRRIEAGTVVGGWPRTSGDDPKAVAKMGATYKLAPHERGGSANDKKNSPERIGWPRTSGDDPKE